MQVTVIDELPYQLQERNFILYKKIKSRQQVTLRYSITPAERGEYSFGNMRLFFSSGLRLLKRRFTMPAAQTVQVYPSKNVFSINSIYPNPANNTLMVAFNSVSTNATTLLVTDMLGRVVQKNVLFPVAGFNKTDMNIALLAKGK